MLVTPLPIVTVVNPEQPLNAYEPMVFTVSEMVILVNPLQSRKTESPILVTLLGIETLPLIAFGIIINFVFSLL